MRYCAGAAGSFLVARGAGTLMVRRRRPGSFAKDIIDLMQPFASQSDIGRRNPRQFFREIAEKSASWRRQPAQVAVPC